MKSLEINYNAESEIDFTRIGNSKVNEEEILSLLAIIKLRKTINFLKQADIEMHFQDSSFQILHFR